MAVGRRWGIVAVVATAITVASLVPIPETGENVTWLVPSDALAHVAGYAVLATSIANAFHEPGRGLASSLGLAVGLAIAFGFGVELLQGLVPTRQFSFVDNLANAIGAALGVVGWLAVRRNSSD